MRNPKSYSIAEVFNNTEIGFVFEFYTSKSIGFMEKDISNILGKRVIVTSDESYNPTWTSAVLLENFKAARSKYTLKVGPQQYDNIKPGLRILLMWINENATLDRSTKMSVDLSFNHRNLQTLRTISNMNVGKMLLKFNESYVNDKFPDSVNNPSAMSIKKIVPLANFVNSSQVIHRVEDVFQLPISEHYGIDFTNYHHGNLRFNYIIGEDYADSPEDVEQVLEYYVITTYQSLNETDYTKKEVAELGRMSKNYLHLKNLWYNPERFLKEYKDMKVMIDLNTGNDLIKTHWDHIRRPLFKLLFESEITKGKFNWDSDAGAFQVSKAKIDGAFMSDIEIVQCELNGCVLERVEMWGSNIQNTRIKNSIVVSKNQINECVLDSVRADRSNKIEESYIKNRGEIINCKLNNTIIQDAGLGNDAKLDEGSIVINKKEFMPQLVKGVESPEIRDYRWIKSLRDDDYEDTGYGNEYKTNY